MVKAKQVRVWINSPDFQFTVLYVGKELCMIRELDGHESSLTIEYVETETIQKNKLKKDLNEDN